MTEFRDKVDADIRDWSRDFGTSAEPNTRAAKFVEKKGWRVWSRADDEIEVFVGQPKGCRGWGYAIFYEGEEMWMASGYDDHDSATVAGLIAAGADCWPDDPRMGTLTVRMGADLWRMVRELSERVADLENELKDKEDK